MWLNAFAKQGGSDQNQETQSEHFDGGIVFDKFTDGLRGQHHHANRDDDGDDHDWDVLDHADGGDDGVQREYQIPKRLFEPTLDRMCHGGGLLFFGVAGKRVMDFLCGFPNEEQPAKEENQIAPGKPMAGDVEQILG